MRVYLFIATIFLLSLGQGASAVAATHAKVFPAAIMEFKARGMGLKGYGPKITDALFAIMSADPQIYLVDRQELGGLMNEYQLNLSGMVNSQQAVRVGQLTGAKILINGTISEFDNHLILVAKIIGTETSRVLGVSVRGQISDEIYPLVESLAEKVMQTITTRSEELVPAIPTKKDLIEILTKKIGKKSLPSIAVEISEHHIGQATVDPAAQTEFISIAKATRFDVYEMSSALSKKADLLIKGEGFSEFAGQRGDIVSVKARLEVRAVDPSSGKIVAIDRQTAVEVDLSEHIAGKMALQQAAAAIAERMLPKLVQNK